MSENFPRYVPLIFFAAMVMLIGFLVVGDGPEGDPTPTVTATLETMATVIPLATPTATAAP